MPAHGRPGSVDRLHGKFTTCLLAIFVFLYWQIYRLTIGNSLYLLFSCHTVTSLLGCLVLVAIFLQSLPVAISQTDNHI
jgi:hypothetical protein